MTRQALTSEPVGASFVPSAKGATLTEQVYAHLREALIHGRFRRGETISGRELALSFGLSKTPVAEAIRQLVRERALEITPNGTVRVPIFGPDEVREMWALTLLLERRMVDAVIAKATGRDLAELEMILEALEESKRRREGRESETLVRSMTFRVYDIGALPQTRDFLMTLWAQMGPNRGLLAAPLRALGKEQFGRRLLAALRRRDAGTYWSIFGEGIDRVFKAWLALLGEEDPIEDGPVPARKRPGKPRLPLGRRA